MSTDGIVKLIVSENEVHWFFANGEGQDTFEDVKRNVTNHFDSEPIDLHIYWLGDYFEECEDGNYWVDYKVIVDVPNRTVSEFEIVHDEEILRQESSF